MDKRDFKIIEDGTIYELDNYRVIDGKGISKVSECACGTTTTCDKCGAETHTRIGFVRGSKVGSESVEKHDGILHETLLSMMIHDLTFKNKLVPSRETSLAITKLTEGLMWMEERQKNREKQMW